MMNRAIRISLGILVLVLLLGFLGSGSRSPPPPARPVPTISSEDAPTISAEDAQVLERAVEQFQAIGAVHSVDVERHIVRYHLSFWLLLNVEDKQQSVRFFSAYFKSKGKSGWVEILSDRNDEKLATYDSWHGIRILR